MVGFLSYDLYYRKLGLNIISYLDVSEILFSFVNLIFPIIYFVISFIILMFLMLLRDKEEERQEKERTKLREKILTKKKKPKTRIQLYKRFFRGIKVGFLKHHYKLVINSLISIVVNAIINIIVVAIWLFSLWYILVLIFQTFDAISKINNSRLFLDDIVVQLSIMVTWLMIIFLYVYIKSENKNIKLGKDIYVLITLFTLIANLNLYSRNQVINVLNDNAKSEITFQYLDKIYTTESNKNTLIGITKNYVFIRDNTQEVNLIFKLTDIKNLAIKPILKNNDDK